MKVVQSDPAILGGTLVFSGTRVPVQTLIDYLNDGFSLEQFLEFFPLVKRGDALAFLGSIDAKRRECLSDNNC